MDLAKNNSVVNEMPRDVLPSLQITTPIAAHEVRFANTIEPARRNCKSSSR